MTNRAEEFIFHRSKYIEKDGESLSYFQDWINGEIESDSLFEQKLSETARKLLNHEDEMVRRCAIQSLGCVGDENDVELLKNLFSTDLQLEAKRAIMKVENKIKKKILDEQDKDGDNFLKYVLSGNIELIQTYFDNGHNPNFENRRGETALGIYAGYGFNNSELLRTLLNNGCDPNIQPEKGLLPLTRAMTYYVGRDDENLLMEFIKVLLEFNLDINQKERNSNNTYLDEAKYYELEKVIKLLKDNGINM